MRILVNKLSRRDLLFLVGACAFAALLVVGPLNARVQAPVMITGKPARETTSTSATFTWQVSVAGAMPSVLCKLDSNAEAACTSPKTYSGLDKGDHVFVVRLRDRSGRDLGSDTYSWKIVSAPPPTPTPEPPPTDKGTLPPLAHAIVGTQGNDVLRGTPGDDVIFGLGGNDTIDGLGGNDVLVGGPGNDTLTGGDGKDKLIGGPGKDSFSGGSGNDTIYAVDGGLDKSVNGGLGKNIGYFDAADKTLHPGLNSFEKNYYVKTPPIVFEKNNWIWAVTANGTGLKPIPQIPGPMNTYRSDPVWSPDGTKIAFVLSQQPNHHSELGGIPSDIWVMNSDGSNAHAITQTADYCEREPEWSPDGTRIAYYVVKCSGAVDNKLVHKTLALNATPWVAGISIGYTGISWRADGAYLYGGYCTHWGSTYRVDPWGTPGNSPPIDPSAGILRTPQVDGYCAGRPSLSPGQPYQMLFGWFTCGYFESQGKPLPAAAAQGLRLKSDDAEASSAGTLVVGFGPVTPNWSNGNSFTASWSGDGQKVVFSRGGKLWTMNKDGSNKKDLGVDGNDPDWR